MSQDLKGLASSSLPRRTCAMETRDQSTSRNRHLVRGRRIKRSPTSGSLVGAVGGCSVDIGRRTDGPMKKQIHPVVSAFRFDWFDGSIDDRAIQSSIGCFLMERFRLPPIQDRGGHGRRSTRENTTRTVIKEPSSGLWALGLSSIDCVYSARQWNVMRSTRCGGMGWF